MGQMMDGGAAVPEAPGATSAPWASAAGPAPGDLDVQLPTNAATGTGEAPTAPIHENLSIMQRFANLLGKDPKERAENAKVFAAMVKDVGSLGANMQQSTLMKRMMTEQMRAPLAIMGGGQASGGVGAIPRSFDPGEAAASMNRVGYK
jgi:hypothetical protein